MSPIIIYERLATTVDDLARFCARVEHSALSATDALALGALWVRLDDLVEQLPESLQQDEETAAFEAE